MGWRGAAVPSSLDSHLTFPLSHIPPPSPCPSLSPSISGSPCTRNRYKQVYSGCPQLELTRSSTALTARAAGVTGKRCRGAPDAEYSKLASVEEGSPLSPTACTVGGGQGVSRGKKGSGQAAVEAWGAGGGTERGVGLCHGQTTKSTSVGLKC